MSASQSLDQECRWNVRRSEKCPREFISFHFLRVQSSGLESLGH